MRFAWFVVHAGFSLCWLLPQPGYAESRLATLSMAAQQAIVQHINQQRASLGVAEMPPLQWDDHLAEFAGRTAASCRMAHTSLAQRSNIPSRVGQYVGENLAIGFASGMQLADAADDAKVGRYFRQAIDGWWREQANYDYAANRCAPGKQCGHYTQLAWRATSRVGCGLAMCNPQADLRRPGYTIACNFAPGGNYAGQRPY